MESLAKFLFQIISLENNSIDIDLQPNLCTICHYQICPSLTKSITILSCKHFFHKECIAEYDFDTCPLCQTENQKDQPIFQQIKSNSQCINLDC